MRWCCYAEERDAEDGDENTRSGATAAVRRFLLSFRETKLINLARITWSSLAAASICLPIVGAKAATSLSFAEQIIVRTVGWQVFSCGAAGWLGSPLALLRAQRSWRPRHRVFAAHNPHHRNRA